MSRPVSEQRGLMIAILALAALVCLFGGICALGLATGEISFGRPLRVSYRLAQSPIGFWVVWCIWASLAGASAYAAWTLRRHWPRHRA
ncbi:MAG: hypothetical protein ACT4QA_13460 [Panacagrimonas sp.]